MPEVLGEKVYFVDMLKAKTCSFQKSGFFCIMIIMQNVKIPGPPRSRESHYGARSVREQQYIRSFSDLFSPHLRGLTHGSTPTAEVTPRSLLT